MPRNYRLHITYLWYIILDWEGFKMIICFVFLAVIFLYCLGDGFLYRLSDGFWFCLKVIGFILLTYGILYLIGRR